VPARSRHLDPAEASKARQGDCARKPGRGRRQDPIEYRVVSVTVNGDKAKIIARLLELPLPAERKSD
jgi:hypothetical protein